MPETTPHPAFHAGTDRRAWEWLGAHPVITSAGKVWRFAVWAPEARSVCLVGEFNRWDRSADPMARSDDGVWTLEVPAERFAAPEGDSAERFRTYKYLICDKEGALHYRADPYGLRMERQPGTASILREAADYQWRDADWMEKRAAWNPLTSPVSVYEVHAGSWKRGENNRPLTWTELGDQLIPYVQEMGYTHIELMPVMEHPYDGSWGYQVTGYFSATSRWGTPEELMAFIDRCHQAGLGVILDWVPAHFPKDENGLKCFDGSCLYEHPDPRRGEMPQWGTCLFNFARPEVRSFLGSNAFFWLERFHADGLRVDAVSAILYHDFGRPADRWLPNDRGGRENREGMAFLRELNTAVKETFPGVMMIAEESTAFPRVTGDPEEGGLGFTLKWNMGWMHDTLAYIAEDPLWRKFHHDKITFSLTYAFSEHYILPFSHDEVTGGRKSMLDKQPGDIWKKFAGLRALYGFTMAHPGKKLLFMGGEFGPFTEWRCSEPLEWFLLLYDMHPQLRACVQRLNLLYREIPALHDDTLDWDGFRWIQVDDRDNSVFAFLRTDREGQSLLCVTNFTPVPHENYRLGLPGEGTLTEILNTDRNCFGGSDMHNPDPIRTEATPCQDFGHSAVLRIPPLAAVWLRYEPAEPLSPSAGAE